MVKKELGKLEMKKEKKKKGEIEALFSEAEMLDMSLMPSDVYYPPRQLCFQGKATLLLIMNAITASLRQIIEN